MMIAPLPYSSPPSSFFPASKFLGNPLVVSFLRNIQYFLSHKPFHDSLLTCLRLLLYRVLLRNLASASVQGFQKYNEKSIRSDFGSIPMDFRKLAVSFPRGSNRCGRMVGSLGIRFSQNKRIVIKPFNLWKPFIIPGPYEPSIYHHSCIALSIISKRIS